MDRLATSRPLGERSEPFLAVKRATARRRSRERSSFVPKSDEGLFESLRDCAIIIRRGGGVEKLEGVGALHKIAAKIYGGGLKVKITHLTERGGA